MMLIPRNEKIVSYLCKSPSISFSGVVIARVIFCSPTGTESQEINLRWTSFCRSDEELITQIARVIFNHLLIQVQDFRIGMMQLKDVLTDDACFYVIKHLSKIICCHRAAIGTDFYRVDNVKDDALDICCNEKIPLMIAVFLRGSRRQDTDDSQMP